MADARADSTIVIGYDGSEGAGTAVTGAANVVGERRVLIVCVYQPAQPMVIPSGLGVPAGVLTAEDVDAIRQHAEDVARKGVQLARESGLEAEPVALGADDRVADVIVRFARERDAAAIVVGSRGLGGVRSALLGSVSAGVLHEADRPVVVIPQ